MTHESHEVLLAQVAELELLYGTRQSQLNDARVRISELEAQVFSLQCKLTETRDALEVAHARTEHWQQIAAHYEDISKNLERQVELLRQALSP
jgi:hypothetical protein